MNSYLSNKDNRKILNWIEKYYFLYNTPRGYGSSSRIYRERYEFLKLFMPEFIDDSMQRFIGESQYPYRRDESYGYHICSMFIDEMDFLSEEQKNYVKNQIALDITESFQCDGVLGKELNALIKYPSIEKGAALYLGLGNRYDKNSSKFKTDQHLTNATFKFDLSKPNRNKRIYRIK